MRWDPCCVHQLCVMDPLSLSLAGTRVPTRSPQPPMSMLCSSSGDPTSALSLSFCLSLSAGSRSAAGESVPLPSRRAASGDISKPPLPCGPGILDTRHRCLQLSRSNCPDFFQSLSFLPRDFRKEFALTGWRGSRRSLAGCAEHSVGDGSLAVSLSSNSAHA